MRSDVTMQNFLNSIFLLVDLSIEKRTGPVMFTLPFAVHVSIEKTVTLFFILPGFPIPKSCYWLKSRAISFMEGATEPLISKAAYYKKRGLWEPSMALHYVYASVLLLEIFPPEMIWQVLFEIRICRKNINTIGVSEEKLRGPY